MSVQELAKFVLVVQSSCLEENFYIIYIKMFITSLVCLLQYSAIASPCHHTIIGW